MLYVSIVSKVYYCHVTKKVSNGSNDSGRHVLTLTFAVDLQPLSFASMRSWGRVGVSVFLKIDSNGSQVCTT